MKKIAYVFCPHEPHKDPRITFALDELKLRYKVLAFGLQNSSEKINKSTSNNRIQLHRLDGSIWKDQVIEFLKLQDTYIKSNSLRFLNRALKFLYITNLYKLLFKVVPKYKIFNHLLYELSYSVPLLMISENHGYAPYLIQVNDIYTLLAGIVLKAKYKSKLIYDSHELYPESIPFSPSDHTSVLFYFFR